MTLTIKTQIENLVSLKGQKEYAINCLMNSINEMEDFEVKEFLKMKSDLNSEILFLENHLKRVA